MKLWLGNTGRLVLDGFGRISLCADCPCEEAVSPALFADCTDIDAATGTLTFPQPESGGLMTQQNDLLFAFIVNGRNVVPTPPSGWTPLQTGTSFISLGWWFGYVKAGASQVMNRTWTESGSAVSGCMWIVRGYQDSITHARNTNTSGATLTAPSVTSPANNSLLLCAFGSASGTISGISASMTVLYTNSPGGGYRNSASAYEVVASGATGTRTASSSLSGPWVAISAVMPPI